MNSNVTFKVDTAALKSVADSIRVELNQIRNTFNDFNTTVNKTAYYWSSDAADEIRRTYAGFQERINAAAAGIEEQVIDLGAVAGIYEKAESENSQKPLTLSDDVIF